MFNWVKGLRRFGLMAIICSFTLALTSTVAHAQGFSITNLTSKSASKGSYPTMVVDSKGNLNLVWIDAVNGIQFARSKSSTTGTSFATPFPVSIPGSTGQALPVFQPQLAVYPTQDSVIEIVWAALDPAPTTTVKTYDVFASRSDNGGVSFTTTTTPISTTPTTLTGVPLADSPRLAFDATGKVNVVWGQHDVLISQSQDGKTFSSAPISLVPPGTPVDTGGPRIAVIPAGNIFVAWTDEIAKDNPQPGNYCTNKTTDVNGKVTNAFGGNFWMNETFPATVVGGPVNISHLNTRNLSNTDWTVKDANPQFSLGLGFFGCSYDNLSMFVDNVGLLHLLWSDDTPDEDVLTSGPHGTNANGYSVFSFPFNLASHTAAWPQVAVDKKGSFYMVWSGGPSAQLGSQGIFFIRSDDSGEKFSPAINIAPSGSIAPAFPQIAVDSNSDVNIAWEQPTGALKRDGSDMFNVFFARSTDKGNTFPTVLPVTTNPSVLCFKVPPAPEGTGAPPDTPDVSTCGTVQIGVDANSNPDMVWVNQASGSAIADIDFATPNPPSFSIALTASSASVLAAGSATFNVQITPTNGFNQAVMLSCPNLPTGLTCSFNPAAATSTSTLTVSTQGSVAANSYPFTVAGTSGAATSSKSATLIIGTITASISPSSATIGVQSSANFTLNLSSANGFNGTVNLDCPGLPAGITCTFNPASMSVPGSTTLTVAVSAKPTGSLVHNGPGDWDGLGLQRNTLWTMGFMALALILSGMIAASRRQTPVPLARGLAVMSLVLVLAVGLISCSGGKTSTTPSGGGGGGAANPFSGQITVRAQSGGAATNLTTMSITVP